MTLRIAELIPEPCTEPWDAMSGGQTRRVCARCNKAVHDLSGLTEPELRRAIEGGASMCVQLVVDAGGFVVFPMRAPADVLVPIARLRPRAPPSAAAALAVLAACTPHARPEAPPPEPAAVVTPLVELEHIEHRAAAPTPAPVETYRMGGAVLGAPRDTAVPRLADLEDTVPCDTIAKHPQGRPAGLDAGRALLDDDELAKADLLARCEP